MLECGCSSEGRVVNSKVVGRLVNAFLRAAAATTSPWTSNKRVSWRLFPASATSTTTTIDLHSLPEQEIYLIAHHGSRSAITRRFLRAILVRLTCVKRLVSIQKFDAAFVSRHRASSRAYLKVQEHMLTSEYSSGHSGRFGHEFLGMYCVAFVPLSHILTSISEFDFRVVGDGRSAVARYANNSNYRNDSLIRKESMFRLDSFATTFMLTTL